MEGSLKKYLLLFVCIAAQLNLLQSQEELSRAQLLEELLEDSCHPENITAFYLNIREMQNVTIVYPPSWEYGETDRLPGLYTRHSHGFYTQYSQSHDLIRLGIFYLSKLLVKNWTWCVYLFSENLDIHACFMGGKVPNQTWATPAFKKLRLMDRLRNTVPPGDSYPRSVTINISDGYQFPSGISIWDKAMSCFKIVNDDFTSFAWCQILNVERVVHITDISTQEDSFLVSGVQKNLHCKVHGNYEASVYHTGWRRSPNIALPRKLYPCDKEEPCEDIIFYSSLDEQEQDSCNQSQQLNDQFSTLVTNRMVLDFRNPTIYDTGAYECFVEPPNDVQNAAIILYVYVVFVEVFETALPYFQEGELRCTVKAPSDATITIQQNGQEIARQYNPEDSSDSCNDLPQILHSVTVLDDQFSMFSIQIKICHVTGQSVGTYQCLVEYSIPTDSRPQQAQITTNVGRMLTTTEANVIGYVIIWLCLMLLLFFCLMVACIIVYCKLASRKQASRKRELHQRKDLESYSPTFTPESPILLKVTSFSPGGDSMMDYMELAKDNLKLHQEIGKGRFGKVMLASAHNSIPFVATTLNQVAVKMPISNTPQNNDLILTELEVMKQLGSNEHICNLLAYCTVDEPVFIIMEYALHGNLKEYLNLCRESVLQSGQPLTISHADAGNGDGSDSDEKQPGLLSEADVRNFAFQVACGLEHLKTMNVVHCDLAARNVLVCEGFLLKIGDFGLARKTSDNQVIDLEEVAVKWAPVEALERKEYTFKSDVWSYAVIIWEIATYGEKPFLDHNICVGLNRFVQFLRAGHRLPQPNGLSDSIYEMLLRCWSVAPSDRPSFTDLMQFFQDMDN